MAVHILVWSLASAETIRELLLGHGQFKPWQWITSVFLHANWFHLIGNMLVLWVFGMVVEGKIGWRAFLLLYLSIAATAGAIEQTLMFFSQGAALGASGVIFGLLAIAMVWAPENRVDCILILGRVFTLQVTIRTFAYIMVGWELLTASLDGFAMSSAVLHLLGAGVGLPIGIVMLRKGWVDCEGWDWFSRRDGGDRVAAPSTTPPKPRMASSIPAVPTVVERVAKAVKAVADGDLDAAAAMLAAGCPASELPLEARRAIALHLVETGRGHDALPHLADILVTAPEDVGLRLRYPRLLVSAQP